MTSLPLDPKKLLGFKLISLTPAKPGAAIAIKQGGKELISLTPAKSGVAIAIKQGGKGVTQLAAKVGFKGIDLSRRG